MPLTRSYYDVLLDDPETGPDATIEHRVEVRAADHLRGEMEGKRIPRLEGKEPMHLTYLWVWAALVREGKFSGSFGDLMKVLVLAKPDQDATEPVDPTEQAASNGPA